MADRGLDAGLDRPAQRPVLQAAPGPPDIVGAVDPEKRSVSPVAQVSEEDEVLRHRVEHVAVEHEIAAPDRKSTRLNSRHLGISYPVFCLTKTPPECRWHSLCPPNPPPRSAQHTSPRQ